MLIVRLRVGVDDVGWANVRRRRKRRRMKMGSACG